MRRLCGLAIALAFALAGCQTTAGQQLATRLGPDAGKDLITVLQQVKANPLLKIVAQDSKATRGWADARKAAGKMDAVTYRLATACPDAVDAVGGLIDTTIDDLVGQIQVATAPPGVDQPQGFAMLFLTQLKYGDQASPQDRIAALKKALALQTDALFTGCAHLYPRKQVNELAALLGKAGALGASGGAAAPFLGALP